jgi:DUF4097 and DUF4098 domain-containing protein YvlB
MSLFPTPTPILLSISAQVADVELLASDRADTVVHVTPANPAKRGDVTAAERTLVDHVEDRITITGPRKFSVLGPSDAIAITVEVPTGSRIHTELAYGGIRARGRFGDCRAKTAYGEISFEHIGIAELRTGGGDITVGEVAGDAQLVAGDGTVRVDLVDGSAVVKSSNGNLVIGEVSGELDATTATGSVEVHFPGTVTAVKTAYGKVRIGDAPSGSLRLESSYGEIEVGVPVGTAAWLDVSSGHGLVRSELNADDAPAASERTVEVRARTKYGDILIRRPLTRRPGDRRDTRTIDRKDT